MSCHTTLPYALARPELRATVHFARANLLDPPADDHRFDVLFCRNVLADMEPADLAQRLQDAWRAFHRGDFQAAYEAGEALGPLGASVAVKAIGIHATYLVDDEAEQLKRFEQAAKLAEAAIKALPDEANSHYRHAFALGRYSQGLSIAKALKQGIAGKVRISLEAALERDNFMSAEQAKDWGLIDEILESRAQAEPEAK